MPSPTRLAKEGELTASGVAYAVIMMPVFEFVIMLLGKFLENIQESALLVHFLTAAGYCVCVRVNVNARVFVCVRLFVHLYVCPSGKQACQIIID